MAVQRGSVPCLRSHSQQGEVSGVPSPSFWFQSPMSSPFGYTVSQAGRVTNARRCWSRRGVCADLKVGVLGLADSWGSLRRWVLGWKGSEWELAERSNGGRGKLSGGKMKILIRFNSICKLLLMKTKQWHCPPLADQSTWSPQSHQLCNRGAGQANRQKNPQQAFCGGCWRVQPFEESYRWRFGIWSIFWAVFFNKV